MPAVADDFRLTVEFEDEGSILPFGRILRERQFERELREQLGRGVVVTHDGPHVFLYTENLEQARAAEQAVRDVLAHQVVEAQVPPVDRWHPVEQRWVDASAPVPRTDEEIEAERERREQRQERESQESGLAEWEVRVDLPSHGAAVDLAERLEAEGISPLVRRWKYLLLGTATEDDAQTLAQRIRSEAPPEADVKVEPSSTIGWELTGANPFATFGAFGPRP